MATMATKMDRKSRRSGAEWRKTLLQQGVGAGQFRLGHEQGHDGLAGGQHERGEGRLQRQEQVDERPRAGDDDGDDGQGRQHLTADHQPFAVEAVAEPAGDGAEDQHGA